MAICEYPLANYKLGPSLRHINFLRLRQLWPPIRYLSINRVLPRHILYGGHDLYHERPAPHYRSHIWDIRR